MDAAGLMRDKARVGSAPAAGMLLAPDSLNDWRIAAGFLDAARYRLAAGGVDGRGACHRRATAGWLQNPVDVTGSSRAAFGPFCRYGNAARSVLRTIYRSRSVGAVVDGDGYIPIVSNTKTAGAAPRFAHRDCLFCIRREDRCGQSSCRDQQ